MNIFKNRIIVFLFGLSVSSFMLPVSCRTNVVNTVESTQKKLRLISIDYNKIAAHEQYVLRAQKRYRYLKPLLTVCGLSCVLVYFYYTSASLSDEERDKIKKIIEDKNTQEQQKNTYDPLDWLKSSTRSIGGLAVELVGGALIIPPLSELMGKVTGSAHVTSSLELYDKEYTHCNALITQIARDMQMSLASQAEGKDVFVGASEVVNACNRLMHRIEKLLGFMRVLVKKFPVGLLRQEAKSIEKRFICYTNELCNDMQCLLDATELNYEAALELIVQFAQRYAQEMQRFNFLEQDAGESA